MNIDYTDPAWLLRLMDATGVNIAELSRRTGVSRDQIERLRVDGTKTRVTTAASLAAALQNGDA